MGAFLARPVTTKVEQRAGNCLYRVGSSSVNGYRSGMEDAHAMDLRPERGFFGVFDGHGGAAASRYVASRLPEKACEVDLQLSEEEVEQHITRLCLEVDREYVAGRNRDGTTGAMFLTAPISPTASRHRVAVANVGDSRVLIGRGGECIASTEDHRPAVPGERERIHNQGGKVSNNRVDGSLAVSRAFGDKDYKQTGGPYTHKVVAVPDVTHLVCGSEDFVVLCCDGVFEGDFSNEDVVAYVAECLRETDRLAKVCSMVCDEALRRGSRDNISVMIVQFRDGSGEDSGVDCIPGPYSEPGDPKFREAYAAMCGAAGVTVPAMLEKRHDSVEEELAELERGVALAGHQQDAVDALHSELADFHARGSPPPKGAPGRADWFECWLRDKVDALSSGESCKSSGLKKVLELKQGSGLPWPAVIGMLHDRLDGAVA